LSAQAGFGHDYDCVSQDVPAYDHLIRVLPRCFTEVMLRIANPLRGMFPGQHRNGAKGEQLALAVLGLFWLLALGFGALQQHVHCTVMEDNVVCCKRYARVPS
jgi:hypothetical protein